MKLLFLTLSLFINFSANSFTKDKINFQDNIKVNDKTLVLNGVGIRKATFLKIKVYYGALYLEHKSKDSQSFLQNNETKIITMNFVREVDQKKLQDAFKEGFEGSVKNHETLKSNLEKFISLLPNVKEGHQLTLTFNNEGVLFRNNEGKLDKILSLEFSKALFSIWFVNPKDENLRNGLLGLE